MENKEIATTEKSMVTATTNSVSQFFKKDAVRSRFEEMLGKKAQGFITSVLQVCASNDMLSRADAQSVYGAAATAATLDLPINNNLGFAYIVPYNSKQKDGSFKVVAQFQMGYKGFIQLAQRSGQFKTIAAAPIYEGQLVKENPLTGFEFDFTKKESDKVIGYAGYFELINGFQKTLYMTVDDLKNHGGKYSQTFKKGYGLWKDDFDSMAQKTVIKLVLSKYAPMSIEMQRATLSDQAVLKDPENPEYVDNSHIVLDADEVSDRKEYERIEAHIESAKSEAELSQVRDHINDDFLLALYDEKEKSLKKGGTK